MFSRMFQKTKSSHPEVFLGEGVLQIYTKFTGEHPCQSVISIKMQSNFIEITIRQWVFSCKICCLFSEYLFLRTPLEGCFWKTFLVTTWPWTGIILVLIIRQVLATGMSFLNLFSWIKLKITRHAVTFQ